jgi:hypothetical protein
VETKQEPKEKRKVLMTVDDFKLNQWLHNREPVWNETPADILEQAKALSIDGLNVRHIQHRLEAFADTLPKASPPVRELTIIERLERVEKGLAIFAQHIVGSDLTIVDRAWLADFLHERGEYPRLGNVAPAAQQQQSMSVANAAPGTVHGTIAKTHHTIGVRTPKPV